MEWLDALKGFLGDVGEDAASMFDASSSVSGPSLDVGNLDSLSDFMGSYGKKGGITRNITAPIPTIEDYWKQSGDEYIKDVDKQPVTGRFDLMAEGEDTSVKDLFGDSDYDKLKMWGLVGDKVADIASYPTKTTAALGDIEARGLQGLRPGSSLDVIKETSSPSYAADLAELAADKIRREEKKDWKELLTKAIGGEDDVPEYGGEGDRWDRSIASSIGDMSEEEFLPLMNAVINSDYYTEEEDKEHGHMSRMTPEQIESLNTDAKRIPSKEELKGTQDTYPGEHFTVKDSVQNARWEGNLPALTQGYDERDEERLREILSGSKTDREQVKHDIRVAGPSIKVETPKDKLSKIAAAMAVSDKLDFFDELEENKKQKELEDKMNVIKEQQEAKEDAEWMRLQQEKLKDLSVTPTQITPIRWS